MREVAESALTKIGPGFYELRLLSWRAFVDYVCDEMLEYQTYIWRGHRRDDWKLEPTIARVATKANLDGMSLYDFQERHLAQFKFSARGRRGINPPLINDENDWWALGQHHGLATPLLDWTTSPFVAAFFAFLDVDPMPSGYRAIFALHSPTLEGWVSHKVREENKRRRARQAEIQAGGSPRGLLEHFQLDQPAFPELVLVRPLSDDNHRLINQGGLFTRLRVNKPLEDWVMNNHPEDDDGGMSLVKILIPDSERDVCLRTLNRMNINPLSLFPDLSGASRYCNLFSDVSNY